MAALKKLYPRITFSPGAILGKLMHAHVTDVHHPFFLFTLFIYGPAKNYEIYIYIIWESDFQGTYDRYTFFLRLRLHGRKPSDKLGNDVYYYNAIFSAEIGSLRKPPTLTIT